MLRDASHQQVIQKFSFIESLNLSRGVDRTNRKILGEIEPDLASDAVSSATPKSLSQTPEATSAIVTAAEKAATIDTNWYQTNSDDYSLSLAEIVKYSTSDESADNDRPKSRNYLGKILFALSCSYCVFVLWWVFGHRGHQILVKLTGGRYITLSKSKLEFIDYMERSLDTIDRQLEAEKLNSQEGDRVVYVPVYTPNTTPSLPQLPSSNIPTTPEPVATAKPLLPEALKIPAPPPLPTPPPLANETTTQAPEKVAATKPSVKHTLIGILELGENKSAALFKINGQTRRFWLGEKIGSSEWILESVNEQTVEISSQGKVRSVAVGETF